MVLLHARLAFCMELLDQSLLTDNTGMPDAVAAQENIEKESRTLTVNLVFLLALVNYLYVAYNTKSIDFALLKSIAPSYLASFAIAMIGVAQKAAAAPRKIKS